MSCPISPVADSASHRMRPTTGPQLSDSFIILPAPNRMACRRININPDLFGVDPTHGDGRL
jgi:hypothetical protein